VGVVEGVLLGIDWVELAGDHNHHREVDAVVAADGGPVLGEPPVVAVDVLAVPAERVFEVFLSQAHAAASGANPVPPVATPRAATSASVWSQ